MKTLLLLRHAKSSWKNPDLADHDRPLNVRGKRDAPRMGEFLAEQDLIPDLIVTSTAKRARKTVKKVAAACGYEGEIVKTSALYHAWPDEIVSVLNSLPGDPERVMVVGHNPGMEEYLELLTDEELFMPTATLAQISLPIDHWRELDLDTAGILLNLWRPRELP
jgi:phosphohistidine phosphatase